MLVFVSLEDGDSLRIPASVFCFVYLTTLYDGNSGRYLQAIYDDDYNYHDSYDYYSL